MEDTAAENAKSSHEFISQITVLKQAEERALKITQDAKAQAEKILKDAKEKAVNMQGKSKDEAVAAKNQAIAKARKETDRQIAALIAKAKTDAQKVSGRSIGKADATTLAEGLF
ncbi:hypothetical protein J4441_05850 [Candidatus Micrarchaeota archaeon]|nr:hypothetical protein [Candidatus Micrarchaeota archaeon]